MFLLKIHTFDFFSDIAPAPQLGSAMPSCSVPSILMSFSYFTFLYHFGTLSYPLYLTVWSTC
jgi:hypothetical protein